MAATGQEENITNLIENIMNESRNARQKSLMANMQPLVWKRIQALKKLCLDTIKTEVQFHSKVFELEREFAPKFQAILEKRQDILTSDYKPSDDECTFPGSIANTSETEEEPVQDSPTGVPNFWVDVLKIDEETTKLISKEDEEALKYLKDVKVVVKDDLSYDLNFHFHPNEFFENSVLTKTYYVKCALDEEYPFTFDGPEIYKTTGCEITWKSGKNLTEKKENRPESPYKFFQTYSFFNFFSPPTLTTGDTDIDQEQIEIYLEHDFELGHHLKERIIPRAVLFYLGEIEYENFAISDYDFHDTVCEDDEDDNAIL